MKPGDVVVGVLAGDASAVARLEQVLQTAGHFVGSDAAAVVRDAVHARLDRDGDATAGQARRKIQKNGEVIDAYFSTFANTTR